MPPKDDGTIDLGQGTIYIIDKANGTETAIPATGGKAEVPDFAPETEIPTVFPVRVNAAPEITFTCKAILKDRKMSRKRFVKKLMARGLNRNTANITAKFVQFLKRPYEQCYMEMVLLGGLRLTKDWGDNDGK